MQAIEKYSLISGTLFIRCLIFYVKCGKILRMEQLESVRSLKGGALDDFARVLYERDIQTFERIIVDLARSGNMRDYATVAAMISVIPMRAKAENGTYVDARDGVLEAEDHFNAFLRACANRGCGEDEYMPLLLSAQYAEANSELRAWDKCVDRYLEEMARKDFHKAADYIDKLDKRYRKYSVLIKVDRVYAINRLVSMALFGKNIDKAAIRDVLMDYDIVTDALMAMFGQCKAGERVSIIRLLLAFRNDRRVREFLTDVAQTDPSKSVRDAAAGIERKRKLPADAVAYIERLMSEGTALSADEWYELFGDERFKAVAEKLFFVRFDDDGTAHVLVYNDGKFLDSTDKPFDGDGSTRIYVMHPLEVPESEKSILSFDISQPILQINRPTFQRTSDERECSYRLSGTMIGRDDFKANLKRYGFLFCDKRDAGEPDTVVCFSGRYAVAAECDMPQSSATVSCGKISVYKSSDIVRIKRKLYISSARPVDMKDLPLRIYSELMYAAHKLFGSV